MNRPSARSKRSRRWIWSAPGVFLRSAPSAISPDPQLIFRPVLGGRELEQRTYKIVMLQSHFPLLAIPFATVEDSAHRTAARNLAQSHRPIAFAAEGLRLALCLAFNLSQKKARHPVGGAVLTANLLFVAKLLTYPPFRN